MPGISEARTKLETHRDILLRFMPSRTAPLGMENDNRSLRNPICRRQATTAKSASERSPLIGRVQVTPQTLTCVFNGCSDHSFRGESLAVIESTNGLCLVYRKLFPNPALYSTKTVALATKRNSFANMQSGGFNTKGRSLPVTHARSFVCSANDASPIFLSTCARM